MVEDMLVSHCLHKRRFIVNLFFETWSLTKSNTGKLFFLGFLLGLSKPSFSNDSLFDSYLTIRRHAVTFVDWKLDTTVKGVEFYHAIVECGGRNVIFLRFYNKNKFNVRVSWKEEFATRQIEQKSEGSTGKKQQLLLPGELFQESCTSTTCNDCLILPEHAFPAYKADFISFSFKDISVDKG